MTGYPPILFLVLQALTTAALTAAPLLMLTTGWRLFAALSDVLLGIVAVLSVALGSFLAFAIFEGDWAETLFGPLAGIRTLVIGGVGLVIAMGWHNLGSAEGRARLRSEPAWSFGASFAMGAFWGGVWELSGWLLETFGVMVDG